jgi:hypothetical protein
LVHLVPSKQKPIAAMRFGSTSGLARSESRPP